MVKSAKHETKKAHSKGTATKPKRTASGTGGCCNQTLNVVVLLAKDESGVPQRQVKTFVEMLGFSSGTIGNSLRDLKKRRLVKIEGGVVYPTEEGRSMANTSELPTTNEEVHAYLLEFLSATQKRLFEGMVGGVPHERKKLADTKDINLTPASLGNAISDMKSNGILFYPSKSSVQLVESMCFPFGAYSVSK